MGDWGDAADAQEKILSAKVAGLGLSAPSPASTQDQSHAVATAIGATTVAAVAQDKSSAPEGAAASTTEDDKSKEETPSAAETSLLNKLLREKLVPNTQPIEVQRADPSNPLYSVRSFEDLHLRKEVLQGVYGMGFNRPSKIQETALPLLLADPPQNMIAQSQSGTGKTAAFVLSMISRVDETKRHPQALALAPTLELALQIGEVCTQMAKFCTNIGVTYAIRGRHPQPPVTEQIVIGTPGTVLDWIFKKRAFDATKLNIFVLDEADVMISMQGHQDQSMRIRKKLSPHAQMLLFSATYDQPVMQFAEHMVKNPVIIKLKRQEESLDNIRQVYVMCRNEQEKYESLSSIYGLVSVGQAMIFCQTRKSASWLAKKMSEDGHAVAVLTGELAVEQRMAILDRFRSGKEKLLVTTNVCARGIDVDQVTVVVNYDVPVDVANQHKPDFETYLHRIGRTGRFGKSGLAINLVDGRRSFNTLMEIEKHFGRKIEKIDINDTEQVESLGQ
ncbi:ATP-dependent RNA helicase DDX19A-like [Sycon ciliatum]|uniref:ATP-dependent RNA helicase DDX19A-like n=1 Tax=Sycon ciliatum TaxID=27933 RepID=UPI0020AA2A3D|eukprot:scpid53184/ scgid7261/ ATP-dependent RNA helicase DDX19A; DEAD box RNA helicase DEAD5; DEAD box protein 19A; Eukaryotic translation initiation factor 4A-related sequence 1